MEKQDNRDLSNLDFWEKVAFIYTRFMNRNDKMFDQVGRIAESYLHSDFTVLEIACGTGQITYRLCNLVSSWTATDFSAKMLEEAKRNGESAKVQFRQEDATNLSFSEGVFDAVVISNCLHIMPEPDVALCEIRRVLKTNGILIAPTFVYEPGYSKVKIALMERMGFRTYHKWTAEEYENYVHSYGFAIENSTLLPASPLVEYVLIGRKED